MILTYMFALNGHPQSAPAFSMWSFPPTGNPASVSRPSRSGASSLAIGFILFLLHGVSRPWPGTSWAATSFMLKEGIGENVMGNHGGVQRQVGVDGAGTAGPPP